MLPCNNTLYFLEAQIRRIKAGIPPVTPGEHWAAVAFYALFLTGGIWLFGFSGMHFSG